MVIQATISCIIGIFVAGGALLDAEGSSESNRLHRRSYRWLRFTNWFPLGIAYAAFYMARYNIAAGNTASIRASLNTTATDMGWVISSGSWSYALSAPITGHITDRIGGKYGMVVACVGAGICNVILGWMFSFGAWNLPEFMLLFAFNQLFQGFGTAAVVKINAMWYAPSERGIFSGIFNMLVVSGYYLALGSGGSIVEHLGWPFLFYIPSIMLFSMGAVALMWIRNAPPSGYKHPSLPIMPVTKPLCDANSSPGVSRLLRNPTVWGYLGAISCLSWSRDGLLNWMYSYFDTVRAVPLTSSDHALLGGAWTLGGFVGGVLCGWVSDRVFHSKRMPPIVMFSGLQAVLIYVLYAFGPSVSVETLAALLFFASVFLLGSYTMLSYTIPTDLPVDIAASAGGLFTTAAYLATGLSGAAMSCIIERWGYTIWIATLLTASILSGICTLVGSSLAPLHDDAFEEAVPLNASEVSSSRSRRASLINTQADFFAVENESFFAIFILIGTLGFDVEGNPNAKQLHKRIYRWRRLCNWLPLALVYLVMNMPAHYITQPESREHPDRLELTKDNMDWIHTLGTWCYAITAPVAGHFTDRIGGTRAALVCCVGVGVCHLVLALHFYSSLASKASFMLTYLFSCMFQCFGSVSMCKINAKWYSPSERGVFAGILTSTVLAGSAILADVSNLQNFTVHWSHLFLLSSGLLFALAFVVLEVVHTAPSFVHRPRHKTAFTLGDALCNKQVLGYGVLMVCLSAVKTTLLKDLPFYISKAQSKSIASAEKTLLDLSWLLGGIVGGVLCGCQYDIAAKTQRSYHIGLLCCYQAMAIGVLLCMSHVCTVDTIVVFTVLSGALVLGIEHLVHWTTPMDFSFGICASSAGVLDCAMHAGRGLSGVIVSSNRSSISFVAWMFFLVIVSLLGGLVSFGIHICVNEPPQKCTERIPLYRIRRELEEPISYRRASL